MQNEMNILSEKSQIRIILGVGGLYLLGESSVRLVIGFVPGNYITLIALCWVLILGKNVYCEPVQYRIAIPLCRAAN